MALLGAVCLMSPPARAGSLGCSIAAVSGISLSYSPAASTALTGSGTVTVSCTKSGSNSDTRYLELAADAGLQPLGNQRRAANGTNLLAYSLTRDPAMSTPWGKTGGSLIGATVTSTTPTTVTLGFTFAVAAGQTAAGGSYADTVTLRLYQDGAASPSLTDVNPVLATLPIALTVSTHCSVSSPPGSLNISYTSFQTMAAAASTSLAVTCTKGAPYSVSLDAATGNLLGLDYSLGLSPSGTQLGSGSAQVLSITGTMAGGQAGTCSAGICSASRTHTLTVSY